MSRVSVGIVLLGIGLGCTKTDQQSGASAPPERAQQAADPHPAATLVPRFLGCYALDLNDGHVYRVRLTNAPMGPNWVALSVDAGSTNAPGNQWGWAPVDSTQLTLGWGGIDSAMEFTVTRGTAGFSASGQRQWSSGQPGSSELHPKVRQIECPVRAA